MTDTYKPVAIVTGAGRGIGRAAAIELGRCGYELGLVSRTSAQIEETARLCGGGLVIADDVSRGGSAREIVAKTLARYGRVDAMVHAAGVAHLLGIEQISDEQWRQTIDTNLSPVVYFARELWPIWRKQGGGVMVNVSSYAGRDPFAGLGAYGAAKAGVNLLGLALAREGAEIGVRVHTVAPAATDTQMLRSLPIAVPEKMMLKPQDVARVIVQCVCGDLACTSGEVIYVHQSGGNS